MCICAIQNIYGNIVLVVYNFRMAHSTTVNSKLLSSLFLQINLAVSDLRQGILIFYSKLSLKHCCKNVFLRGISGQTNSNQISVAAAIRFYHINSCQLKKSYGNRKFGKRRKQIKPRSHSDVYPNKEAHSTYCVPTRTEEVR